MKIAIVHDFLHQYGGAERVVESLHDVFPEAPVFTSLFLKDRLPPVFQAMDIRTTFMQRLPFLHRHFKSYLPLYPFAMESLDLRGFDVILSSSSAFAKGVRVPAGALHVCYCHTPMRYVWNREDYLAKEAIPGVIKGALRPVLWALKRWDIRTAGRVNHFVAVSEYIRERIRRAYGRDSTVIYPPVKTGLYALSAQVGDYFLIVSRLAAYKRIDLAIEACNRLRAPLWIVGEGTHGAALRRAAGPTVRFLGRLPQEELSKVLSGCRAFLFPGEEDFGIAPVEAIAAGRPVVAFGAGGALETVVEGETGLFFRAPTPESLLEALRRLDRTSFDPLRCRRRAEMFDKSAFQEKIRAFVEAAFAGRREKL